MQGLASVKQMQKLNLVLTELAEDWLKEGFEADDVQAFVLQRIKEVTRGVENEPSDLRTQEGRNSYSERMQKSKS
jgi:hypothetical protein